MKLLNVAEKNKFGMIAWLLCLVLVMGSIPLSNPVFAEQFADVDSSHWAYSSIMDMVENEVVSGYPDRTFQPNKTINRAEFASILVKSAKIPLNSAGESIFEDVQPDAWYHPYIETVLPYFPGYKDGAQYFYLPYEPALREDITVAVMKVLEEEPEESANRLVQNTFSDYRDISEDAVGYIAKAVSLGIIGGYEDGTFRPKGSVTRAEAAVILSKALELGHVEDKPLRKRKDIPTVDTLVNRVLMEVGYGTESQIETHTPVPVGDILDLHVNEKGYLIASMYEFYDWKIRYIYGPDGPYRLDVGIDEKFTYEYTSHSDDSRISAHTRFKPTGFVKGLTDDQLIILGHRRENNLVTVHQLQPEFKHMGHVANDYNQYPKAIHFGVQIDDDRVVVGDNFTGNIYLLEYGKEPEKISNIFSASKLDRKVKMLAENGSVYTLDSLNKQLIRHQLNANQKEIIETVDVDQITAIATFNNKFYFVGNEPVIYELNLNGDYTPYVDLTKLRFNPGLYGDNGNKFYVEDELVKTLQPFKNIQAFAFTSEGNIIVYDAVLRMIKRINLYEQEALQEKKQSEESDITPQSEEEIEEVKKTKRDQITADALAQKTIDISSMVVDKQGDIYFIENEYKQGSVNKFKIQKYDGDTGNTELLIEDSSLFSAKFLDSTDVQTTDDQVVRKLKMDSRGEKLYMFSTSRNYGIPMIAHVFNDDVETAAFNFDVRFFTDNDFAAISEDTIAYSNISGKKLYVDRAITPDEDRYGNEFLKSMDFEFSGQKTAALITDNQLYVLDTGNQLLSTIDLSSGAMVERNLLNTMEQAVAVGDHFYFTDGPTIYQLSLDGKVELLADLEQIQLNDGIYKPAENKYIPYYGLVKDINRVNKIAVDRLGNPVILDYYGVIWKINIFE